MLDKYRNKEMNKFFGRPFESLFPFTSVLPVHPRVGNLVFTDWEGRLEEANVTIKVDVQIENDNVIVKAEIPGISAKALNVEVEENLLLIEAKVEESVDDQSNGYTLRERYTGSKSRHLKLPYAVDPESTTSTYKDGILEITLPIASKTKVKVIEVK